MFFEIFWVRCCKKRRFLVFESNESLKQVGFTKSSQVLEEQKAFAELCHPEFISGSLASKGIETSEGLFAKDAETSSA